MSNGHRRSQAILMLKFGLFAAYVCVKVMRWVLAVAEKLPPPVAEV
jgi:hypothetical protein